MNPNQRTVIINSFVQHRLSPTARNLFHELIQTWEEALGGDEGLAIELRRLAQDAEFLAFVTRPGGAETRGVELIHALQDLRLVTRLAQKYPVLARIHLDDD